MAASTKKEIVVDPMIISRVEPGSMVNEPLSIKELQEVLVKHYGLHEGKYDLMFEMHFSAGAVGPTPEDTLPGAMVGFSKIGLVVAAEDSKKAVDAAIANPLTRVKKKTLSRP